MNDELSVLSLDDLERVDAACDAFIASWERGERPSLEDLIGNAPESLRHVIAVELIQSEIECRRRAGESPTSNEYVQRFPQWSGEIESRIAELPQTADPNLEVTQQFVPGIDAAGNQGPVANMLVESSTETMIVSPRDLPIAPELLTDYDIRGIVGKGGMGVVVRARDKKLDRDVAIKLMVPEFARNDAARQRFLREARAAAAVRHDHVVTIYSVREVDGVPLLEMELIQGESLAERIQRTGPISALEVARLAIQIARGLDAAHKRGLIHRDIKPGNILLEATEEVATTLVSADGRGFCRAKITDFGLARVASEESLTNSGLIAGTPQYMSPEQAEGTVIDHRSDLFSLGSVMYAMCAGRAPFHADSALGILRQVSDFAPPSLHERNSKIPDWLLAIIERLMAKRPEDRFQSAGDVVEVLSRGYESACRSPASDSGSFRMPHIAPATASMDDRGVRKRLRLVAIAFLPIALFAAVFIIRTSKGEFVLTTQDPAIATQINAAGGLVVENKATKASYTLMPGPNQLPNGDYELIVTAPDGLELTTSRFQLRRFGGAVNATVIARPVLGAGTESVANMNAGESSIAAENTADVSMGVQNIADHSSWRSLINRTSPASTGKKQGTADWHMVGETLIGETSGQMGKLELSPEVPNLYHLRCEIRVSGAGNSGIDVLLHSELGELLRGYHVDFRPTNAGEIAQMDEWKVIQPASNPNINTGEWTRLEIIKTAATLTVVINGSRGADIPIVNGESSGIDLELDGRDGQTRVEVRRLELRDIAGELPVPSENRCLGFDGQKSYVSIPGLSRNRNVPYTLEAWVLPHYRDLDEAVVVMSGDSVLQFGKGYRGFYPIESDTPVSHDRPVKTAQTWVHVAIVVEVNEVRFYVDGKMTHQIPRLKPSGLRYRFGGTWLGAHPSRPNPDNPEISYFFRGHLDEIRMSSVARYQGEFVPVTRHECDADTLALYHCDEGSGKEVRDSSGYNHHGVAVDVNWDLHDAVDVYSVALKRQEQAAAQSSLSVEITNRTGMTLRLIPPGEFLMGAPEEDTIAAVEEKPQHLVRLTRPFYMGTTEVTVGQFRKFVETTGYVTQAESDGQGAFGVQGRAQTRSPNLVWHRMDDDRGQRDDNLPVRGVSWEDARRFCDWLSQSESRTYRLPTEAEWEYACRAGTTTYFSFGDTMDEFQAAGRLGGQAGPLHPVAEFPPNPFGLFDMHGNLNEICLDSGIQYTSEIAIDPVGSLDPTLPSVVRGGACSSASIRLRSSQRYLNDSRSFPGPSFATMVKGFRVIAVGREGTDK